MAAASAADRPTRGRTASAICVSASKRSAARWNSRPGPTRARAFRWCYPGRRKPRCRQTGRTDLEFMMTPPITVSLVEDDHGTRETLAALLNQTPKFRCASACATGEEALRRIPQDKPDVALVDINLPGMNGI